MLTPAYIKIRNWVSVNVDTTTKTITLVVSQSLLPVINPFSTVYLVVNNHPPIRLYFNGLSSSGSSNVQVNFRYTENITISPSTILYFLVRRESVRWINSDPSLVNTFINESESGLSYQYSLNGIYFLNRALNTVDLYNPFLLLENVLVSNTGSQAAGTYNYNLDRNFFFVKVFVLGSLTTFSTFTVNLQTSEDNGSTWSTVRTFSARMSSYAPTTVLLNLNSSYNINASVFYNYRFRVSITLNQATLNSGGSFITYYVSQYYMPNQNSKFRFIVP